MFRKAHGAILEDEEGIEYVDFFSGAGTLNYGHNNPRLKAKLLEYIESDGIVHGLDMATVAKRDFLEAFERIILKPRSLNYKIQFPGPTGTNAVEAAMKIARKASGRENIIAFSNAFHGVTLGSLSATGNAHYRDASRLPSIGTSFLPYDGYLGDGIDTIEYLDKVLRDNSSGVDHPAAVIVETVQGEGGINVASFEWLRSLERVCHEHEVLLIVDDIQVGCGRTGTFFSFEEAGIEPDIVTLAKSLSGYGLPFSLVLMKPELDHWKPGEHNGTFRGNNLAFVTARAALEEYWRDDRFSREVAQKSELLRHRLEEIERDAPHEPLAVRGRGMIQGLDFGNGELAREASSRSFAEGLVIETSGSDGQVMKCLPPLTISEEELERGLDILADCVRETLNDQSSDSLANSEARS